VAGCEHDYFEIFTQVLKDLPGVRPDVDAGLDDLASREGDGQLDVEGRRESVVAVNQRFVQVEDDRLAALVTL
jgi:hypothetical protein